MHKKVDVGECGHKVLTFGCQNCIETRDKYERDREVASAIGAMLKSEPDAITAISTDGQYALQQCAQAHGYLQLILEQDSAIDSSDIDTLRHMWADFAYMTSEIFEKTKEIARRPKG